MGETFTLEIRADNVGPVTSAPFTLTFDPNMVEPEAVSAGDFSAKTGHADQLLQLRGPKWLYQLKSLSPPGEAAVEGGSGVLATAVFRAKKQGTAAFGFRDVAFTSANGTPLPVVPVATSLSIQ